MNYNYISHNNNAVRSDGVIISAKVDGLPAAFGVTLASATRYMFPFGHDRAPVPSEAQIVCIQMRWDNTIAFTATIEDCLFPSFSPSDDLRGVTDVSDFDVTAGNWIPVRPPDAYVEVTGGGTYTIATGVIAVAAGQQGGVSINLAEWGARRGRINLLTGAAGGLVRHGVWGKAAS